jgi:hypothetical protein
LLISNLQASNVVAGINVTFPRALDGTLNAIIQSELLLLDLEAIETEWKYLNKSLQNSQDYQRIIHSE